MPCEGCNQSALNRVLAVAKGGFKLVLAKSGLSQVSDDILEERKRICLECPQYDFGVCNACGCFLAAKASLKGEQCPEDRWPDGN